MLSSRYSGLRTAGYASSASSDDADGGPRRRPRLGGAYDEYADADADADASYDEDASEAEYASSDAE